MKTRFRGRIYPNGSSDPVAVDVNVDGLGNLVATDGENSARWPVDKITLKLGGCLEDRLVMACPSGDTIISSDFSLLDALTAAGAANVKAVKNHRAFARARRFFTGSGALMALGIPFLLGMIFFLAVIGLFIAGFMEGLDSKSDGTSVKGEEAESAEAIESRYVESIEQHITKYWHCPKNAKKSLRAVAVYEIMPDGKLQKVRLLQPSGNKQFDAAVKATLSKAQPFPSPPDSKPFEMGFEFTSD